MISSLNSFRVRNALAENFGDRLSKPKLNKPFRTPDGPKKFSVYVKGEKGPKKVNFGDPDAEIKRDDPKRRKAFRDRHGCDNPGPKDKPRYWSCKMWSQKPVSKITKETDGQPGVHSPFWFWAADQNPFMKKNGRADLAPKEPLPAADDQVQKILIETPGISGATMVNALAAKGLKIVDEKKTLEADSTGLHPAVMRPDTFSEWKRRASARKAVEAVKAEEAAEVIPLGNLNTFIHARFMESTPGGGVGPHRFRVALIQEGLGNLRDGFYYTREALESAISAFEGRKCYADHPSRSEEQDRPERSVRDIVGHFQNVALEEGDDGCARLAADLIMLPDPPFEWARALVRQSIEYSKSYPDKEFIGLSINANGDATPMRMDQFLTERSIPEGAKTKILRAKEEGLQQVRVVHRITDAVSTDLVTEPGARGKVLELIEGDKTMPKKEKVKAAESEMEKKDILPHKQAENGDEDHEDVAQDKALILDMIKKHMGEASEGMEAEAEEAAKEAYQAYKEMGYSEEEAQKCAAHAMKLAKHMAAKHAEAEKAEGEEMKKEEAKAAESEEEKKESEGEKKEEEAKHAESDVVKLTARIAFLERELKERTLADTLDKKLKESGLGRAETDKIRTLIGKPRSEAHIDEIVKVFKEAFDARGKSERVENLFVVTEKAATPTEKKNGFSFGDCLKK